MFERSIKAGHNDLYDHPDFAQAAREALTRVEAGLPAKHPDASGPNLTWYSAGSAVRTAGIASLLASTTAQETEASRQERPSLKQLRTRQFDPGRAICEKAFGPALSVSAKLSAAVTVPQSGGFAAHSL